MMEANKDAMTSISSLEKAMVSDVPTIELVIGATDFVINIVAIVLQSI